MKKIKQLEPMEIEKRSFEIISHELSEMQITLPADQEMITKRVIHTSADFDYIQTLKYSKDAVAIAKRLISEGADIVTDTNMALSGINKKYLAKFGGQAHCFMAKNKNESNNKNSGTLLTEKDGTQYFVMGKVRIKVSEHFAQDGKPLDSLLEDVIQHAAAAS